MIQKSTDLEELNSNGHAYSIAPASIAQGTVQEGSRNIVRARIQESLL